MDWAVTSRPTERARPVIGGGKVGGRALHVGSRALLPVAGAMRVRYRGGIGAARFVRMPVAMNRINGSASLAGAPRTSSGQSGFSATSNARSILRVATSFSTLVGVAPLNATA